MSYYPYFRGKSFELITIRENAERMQRAGFVPIIEPVKNDLQTLLRSLDAVRGCHGQAIVIINPKCGELKSDVSSVLTELMQHFAADDGITVGIHLGNQDTTDLFRSLLQDIPLGWDIAVVHDGFLNGADAALVSATDNRIKTHIFVDDGNKLYRRHFRLCPQKVLLRDGFQKRVNREYPLSEFFSELHMTYEEENVQGFGDYLVVGDDFSESGGPAYAIAIHITYIDPAADNGMYIYHFISDRTDTPSDPAGKFAEALDKLVQHVNAPHSKLLRTDAINDFLDLHAMHHFPGLGYVKKLSMQHHIELMAKLLTGESLE
jgi:hypothetical protein